MQAAQRTQNRDARPSGDNNRMGRFSLGSRRFGLIVFCGWLILSAWPVAALVSLMEAKKLVASDGMGTMGLVPGDQLGESVAVSGDTAVAAAAFDDSQKGAVYIFERNQGGANNWGEVKKLTASDGAAFDRFGNAVAISGDTIIVGSNRDDGDQGSAFVFERNQGGVTNWGQVKKLTGSDSTTSDSFGGAVSISGDSVVVGAGGNAGKGAAFVFERNQGGANNWGEVKKLTASDGASGDLFGRSVSVHLDSIIVGASNVNSFAGAAYIFERNQGGANNWGQVKKLTGSDTAGGDNFGSSAALNGDVAVAGAFGKNSGQGAAYVFERNQGGANNWGEVKKLTASDGGAGDFFGLASAISGDTVMVGARADDAEKGSAYNFDRNQGGTNNWGEVQKLTASDGAMGDQFGISVAIQSATVILGASGNAMGKGAAYIFVSSSSPPSITCPANIITSTGLNQCAASVPFAITASGGPPPSVECKIGSLVIASPHTFPVGTTDVNCMATNGNLPNAMCSFTVTVNDAQSPTITCPANQSVNNDADQCGAVVAYPVPMASDNCSLPANAVNCSPASGSFFPIGATTVACTVTDAAGLSANCSFTVTVNDTQGPIIVCPANLTTVISGAGCAGAAPCGAVNYATPTATDCSGGDPVVNCLPPSGSCFALGVTTVICTATDAMSNSSMCSFTVSVFDIRLQDDSNSGVVLLVNSTTGDYRFCCLGAVYTGKAILRTRGCDITVEHSTAAWRLSASISRSTFTGKASLQLLHGTTKCSITDRDIRNDTQICAGN